jgi:hypothetical protein
MPTAYLGGLDFVLRERIAEALSSEARISTSWPSLPCRGREHMPTRESSTVSTTAKGCVLRISPSVAPSQ